MHQYLTCEGPTSAALDVDAPPCPQRYEPLVALADVSAEALRAAAHALGWTSDGQRDRCPVCTARYGALEPSPAPGVAWSQPTGVDVVLGRYGWAKQAHAVIKHADGWYTLYDDPEAIGCLIIEGAFEPHQPVRYAYADMGVHEATTNLAVMAQASWDALIRSRGFALTSTSQNRTARRGV